MVGLGKGNTRLYDVMGVAPDVSQSQLKKAYHQLMMKHHPDRGGPEANEQRTQAITAAYDVLKNPDKRKIYDKLGEKGLQTMGEDGMEGVTALMMNTGVIGCFVFNVYTMILLFFVFVTLKVDGQVDWGWGTTLVPVWIVDAVLGFAVLGLLAGMPSELKAIESKTRKARYVLRLLMSVVTLVAVIVFTVLVSKKLDGDVGMSWVEVFVPMFVLRGISILTLPKDLKREAYTMYCQALGVCPDDGELSYRSFVLNKVWENVVKTATLVLLPLRFDDVYTSSYFVPALPIAISLAAMIVMFALQSWTEGKLHHESDPEAGPFNPISAALGILCSVACAFGPFVAQYVLLVKKCDGSSMSLAVALVPLWIFLGIVGCFLCCAFATMAAGNAGEYDEETVPLAKDEQGPTAAAAAESDDDVDQAAKANTTTGGAGADADAAPTFNTPPPAQNEHVTEDVDEID